MGIVIFGAIVVLAIISGHTGNERAEVKADDPLWLKTAFQELGVSETIGSGDNPRVVDYLNSTSLSSDLANNDETPWCSAFVNWVMDYAGYPKTNSAAARSWLQYGRGTSNPTRGTIVVLERGASHGHVGFFITEEGNKVYLLGGNQSDKVKISGYDKTRVLGYRNPL